MTMLPWAYSKLSLYEKCPAQAKARYIDREKFPTGPAAGRGSEVHKTVEDYLQGTSVKLHDILHPYTHVFERVKEKNPVVEHKIGFTADWQPAPWKDCWGRGVLDSAFVEHHEVQVQEWKTGKEYDDHEEQRKLYLSLALIQWPKEKSYHIQTYYFDLGKKRRLRMEKDEILEVQEDFKARVTIMTLDDEFAPKPGYYCQWCPLSKYKGGKCRVG